MRHALSAACAVLLACLTASCTDEPREASSDEQAGPEAQGADRYVEVDGARVRVREEGAEGAPVLLMMHGFTFSLETWDALAPLLTEDYRVVRYDLLGHGMTGPDPQARYAPEERAAFAGELMEALGIERAVLVGNSLGGLAAWRLAAMSPEKVSALVLIDPGAYPMNGTTEVPAPVPPMLAAYLRTVPAPAFEASIARIYADPSKVPEERLATLREMMRREGNGDAFVASLEEFTLPDPEPVLRTIEAPTLILWGTEDQIIPPADGARLAEVIPNATLVRLDGVGHVAQEEAPEEVAAAIEGFLRDANPGR
ncbi:alpha/beta fold hydrolase [Parvularcula dongshanensis]|uniref:Pimeloyl-ACP methyl ester carboxylesterase n=1 Tax=Parvularcula dongshanensis TaxID=1173995 RepID=A0A840I5R0_9PROT|nr:alpha/beta hydrolase [Parvularcula dongshanensis]MBB4659611.1 pimeloyl-ACP methyl ester carboxylesterase [Parvularcula dongshanensis]